MEVTPSEPPESHDQNSDAENDVSMEDSWSPSKELANLTTDTSYSDHCDQGETQSGELGMDNSHTESKASEKSSCKMQQGAIFSGKILSFCCSECKSDTTYSPNDLLKHFQGAHKGTLPTYPCDLCTFVTNEFSSLQRHRIGHRDTLVTCEICNDGVQYSLLLLTRHFIMCHSCNGLFNCKKCDFSTRDAGTFVQHIHHHNEVSHKCGKSPTQAKAQSGTFPFTCQFCGYGAARREYLNKHLSVAHVDEMDKAKKWMAADGANSPGLKLLLKKSSPAGGSREPQWMSKLNSLPAVDLLDGRLFNPEKTLQETQQFLERAVGVKKESSKWSKGTLKSESQCSYPVTSTTPQPKTQETELNPGSGILNASSNNGLTVLMVKNKISIPPNCTTKVMGFKMVDGKKHLVLKVIPTKQEASAKTEMSPNSGAEDDEKTVSSPCSSLSQSSGSLRSLDSGTKNDFTASIKVEAQDVENHIGEQSPLLDDQEANLECSGLVVNQLGVKVLENSNRLLTSASASDLMDLDTTMTDETAFSMYQNSHPDMNSTGLSANNSQLPNSPADEVAQAEMQTPSKLFNKCAAALDSDKEVTPPSKSSLDEPKCLQTVVCNMQSDLSTCDALPSALTVNCIADEAAPSSVSGVSSGQMCDLAARECSIESIKDSSKSEGSIKQISPTRSLMEMNPPPVLLAKEKQHSVAAQSETSSESAASTDLNSTSDPVLPSDSPANKVQASDNTVANGESSDATAHGVPLLDTNLKHKTSSCVSPDAKDCNAEVETILQNSPSQEVFSFHNYSKETFGSSPDSLEAEDPSLEDLEEDECEDFGELKLASDWSLTLPPSPPVEEEQSEDYVGSGGECNTGDDPSSASGRKALERVSDSDIEVDECIATVDDDVLPEREKEAACVSESGQKDQADVSPPVEKSTAALRTAAALGRILEKHSDAIISQQLEKERMGSSTATQDTVQPTKTTLRILQTPEGKQQMFLQTPKAPYAVPVQLKSGPGFKLITKSCASKLNVSYVKAGIERPSKGTGLSLTLNGGRIGTSAQGSSAGGKGNASFLQAVGSGGRYFVNASAIKGPLLLSSAVKSASGEQTTNTQPTCYLVQRPQPTAPASNMSTGSTPKTVLTTRPMLAMPVNSADKAGTLGRQAYLVRYISPAKSGILLNNSDGSKGQNSQPNEGGKSRVFLKIVRSPNGTKFLSTTPYAASAKKPIYVAASSLQSPYFLMSSNKSFTSLSAGLKTSVTPHGPAHKFIPAKLKHILPCSSIGIKNRNETGLIKSSHISHTRLPSQRKKRRRALFEDSCETSPKSRRISSKSSAEKEGPTVWQPLAKDKERTLRLSPFSPLQKIKCPRINQPVVVLNHPDADIPEVANIMKSVNRYKSEVVRVALSQSTVKALNEWSPADSDDPLSKQDSDSSWVDSRVRPLGNNIRERFILKLKFKKTSRSKYEIVRSGAPVSEQMPTFSCWFCGRVFHNQEEWIGHGQRHLMEATRDWNKLF